MIRNFVTIALRNIMRHKGYAALNIFGLAVGLACAFFIVIWVQKEADTDQFHEKGDRLYQVMRHSTFGGDKFTTASMTKPLEQYMRDEYPEVEHAALLSWDSWVLLSHGDQAFRTNGRWAGIPFFEMFSFPLLLGDPAKALEMPESIVISRSMAVRLFGDDWQAKDDILGTLIRLNNQKDMAITGVFDTLPQTSSLQFDFVLPVEDFVRENTWVEGWNNNGLRLYATLHPGADLAAFNAKIKDVIDEHIDDYESDVFLFPLRDAYLQSSWENGVQTGGRIEAINIFRLVALFVIIIASINFMNLATARSAQRAREIGVRKTVGASRPSLIRQFLVETVAQTLLAFLIAVALLAILMPGFNSMTESSFSLGTMDIGIWLLFAGIAMGTGLLAGSYPAMYLSSFSVTGVFDKRVTSAGRGSGLRKALVVLQFSLSVFLIVGTVTIYRQLNYIMTRDVGLDRENVAIVRLEGGIREQYDSFKSEALQIPGIVSMTTSSSNPLQIGSDTMGVLWEGKDPDDNQLFWNAAVGYDFVQTMGIRMSAGRTFSREFGSDTTNYLVNWKAAEAMGMTDPVGQQITFWDQPGTIVGVMEDFNMNSMYRPITPVIFRLRPDDTGMLFVRIAEQETEPALASFESLYKRFNPDYPLNVRFMDEEFEAQYRMEQLIARLANSFALVAIFVACLGLFGLASYTAEQRTREIGIRKVLGASVPHVVTLLSREFLVLVSVAFLIGAPAAWAFMNDWLDMFAYRADLSLGLIAAVGLGTLLIACVTVSFQAFRSALVDPVKAIRSE